MKILFILVGTAAALLVAFPALATPPSMPSSCRAEVEILGEVEFHPATDDLKEKCNLKNTGGKLPPTCQFSHVRDGYSMKVKIIGTEIFRDFGVCAWKKDEEKLIRVDKSALDDDYIPQAGDVLKGVPPGLKDAASFIPEEIIKQNLFQKLWNWILGWL